MEVTPTPRLTACRPYAALAALAVLLGPVRAYIVPAANDALFRHDLAAEALSSLAAGLLLRNLPGHRTRNRAPAANRAIWLLLLPAFVATLLHTHVVPFLPDRELPWGITTALALAAPLWLALLAATQSVSLDVQRTVAGAAIVGVSTVFLILEAPSYALTPSLVPALLTTIALSISTVYTWAFAASNLRRASALRSAALFLLLRGVFDAVLSLALERTSLRDVAWRDALILLALDAALTSAAMFLWFFLLQNLSLPAFSLHPLAIWTASILGGLLTFGFANWRMDAAAALALAALLVGLRARPADEDPIALKLR